MDQHNKKSILLLTFFNSQKNPGFVKKYNEITFTLENAGFCVTHQNESSDIKSTISWIKKNSKEKYDLIWIRCPGVRMWFLSLYFLYFFKFRKNKTKLILEWASPLTTLIIMFFRRPYVGALRSLEWVLFLSTCFFYRFIFDKMLEYGNEDNWAKLLLGTKKISYIGNLIGLEDVSFTRLLEEDPANLNLLIIATVEYWHGLDRVIEGLKNYYAGSPVETRVDVFIVGQCSPEVKNAISDKFFDSGVLKHIHFLGEKHGEDLVQVVSKSHVGLGVLGAHRSGLNVASPLKDGLYCAFGLPFVTSYKDPRFDNEFDYRKTIPANDEPVNINDLLSWYQALNKKEVMRSMHCYSNNELSSIRLLNPVISMLVKED